MEEIEKQQYQHIGADTAIFVKRGLNIQPTRQQFNNNKLISKIVQTGYKGQKLVIAGYQASNEHGHMKIE